jgi:hypothetical protein
VGNPPEVTSDENSHAEIDDSRTIPDVPINKGYCANRVYLLRSQLTVPQILEVVAPLLSPLLFDRKIGQEVYVITQSI